MTKLYSLTLFAATTMLLPDAYTNDDTPDPKRYITDLISFIISPLLHSIFTSHINSIAAADDSEIPANWGDWWRSEWLDGVVDFKEAVTGMIRNDLPEDTLCLPLQYPTLFPVGCPTCGLLSTTRRGCTKRSSKASVHLQRTRPLHEVD